MSIIVDRYAHMCTGVGGKDFSGVLVHKNMLRCDSSLFVFEVFQLLILTDWAQKMLKDGYLSFFYLTIKLYL